MTSKSNKNIFFYLSSQIVSLLGSSLAQCVMFWYITLVTKSGTLMTAATIAGFIPTFIVSPFAGVWADRFDRKKLIILADALVAAATLGLFIAFRLGFQSVWLIIAVMAVRGFGQGIQQPATGAMLPQLVHPDKLMRVNSIFSSAQSAMMLISPALGGILYAAFPIEFTFGIDVITAAIAILILLLLVKVDKQKPSESTDKIGYFTDLKLGLKYVTTHKFLGRFFMYMIPSCLLTAPAAILFSLHITQKFAGDARMLALNDTAFAVGMLAGSVLMMTWGGFQRKRLTIALGFAVMSIGTIAYGLIPTFRIFAAVTVIVGTSMPLFNTASTVLIQENVENEYLGRVMSLMNMIGALGMPVSMLIFGPLADKIGMWREFIITGTLMFIFSVVFIFDKRIKTAR